MVTRSSLEGLPPELVQQILSLLPDASSLLSAVRASSSLYNAFIGAELLITSQVVRNLINVDVLPEAAAAWKSSRLAPLTRDLLENFIDDQLRSRQSPPLSWTLSEALPLCGLQRHVEFFSLDFASQASDQMFASSDSNNLLRNFPTPGELHRIHRALYRFEIFCNLFRSRKSLAFGMCDQRTLFFSNFSPWENEQLGCIHDYLFYKVYPGRRPSNYESILTLNHECDSFQRDHRP